MRELHQRQWPLAVTSAPRIPLETEVTEEPVTRLALPEGAVIATASAGSQEGEAALELVEMTDLRSRMGRVGIYRVTQGGEVDLHGPDEPPSAADKTDEAPAAEAAPPNGNGNGYAGNGAPDEYAPWQPAAAADPEPLAAEYDEEDRNEPVH